MLDPVSLRIWSNRGLFALIIAGLVFFKLLPLDTAAGGLPGPDLILAFTFAWVLRRPSYVPAGLIVAIFLFCDLIFAQPPGLWATLVLIATEFLRSRQGLSRELPFPLEWAFVALVMVLLFIAHLIALALFALDRPPLAMLTVQLLFTLVAYPFVVAISAWLFGLKKASPGEADALGHRL